MKTAVVILSWFVLTIPCAADIIIVADDGADFNNIQAAIDDSNDGDTIYVFPGRYTGVGNRNIDYGGRAITVQSVLPEDPYVVSVTIIDCEGMGRGFLFQSGEDANSVLDGLTITSGAASGGAGVACNNSHPTVSNCVITGNWARSTYVAPGGGVHCSYSDAAFINCTISDNTAGGPDDYYGEGGGVYCRGGSPTLSNCTIAGNVTRAIASYGGGIYSDSAVVINCTISGNRVERGTYVGGSGGGGVCCWGGTITDCTINGNSSERDGGGIYCWGTRRIEDCVLVDNHASEQGGGIYSRGGGKVIGCEFNGNSAANGGGVYCDQSSLGLTSCTLSGNWSSVNGGGIYCTISTPVVKNCTLSSNLATCAGGGMYNTTSSTEVSNCILWGNGDANGIVESAQIDGDIPEVIFSCIQDDEPNDGNIPFGGTDSNNIDDYPMFVRDPNDGGDGWGVGDDDYGDLHIQDSSPCVNAGDPSILFEPDMGDMDGEPRVMAGIVDMGADELVIPTIVVTRPEGGEVWAGGSIHEIRWYSLIVSGLVDVMLSDDGGGIWQTIESGIDDTGSCMVNLPDIVDSNQCTISVVPNVPDANVVSIPSALFTVHPDSPDAAAASKWESLGGDYDRMGLSENYGPELGCVKWAFETGGAVSASVTIGPNETTYVPCEDGKLYKLDGNGVLVWSYDAGTPLMSAASIGPDGTAYVGGEDGKLYAVDIDGNLRWTHSTAGLIYSSPAVGADGKVYVGSQDGTLYGLGPDGSELWSVETAGFGMLEGAIFASPTIGADGTVYVAGLYDPNLYALEPNDGSVKWVCHFESGGWPFASPVVAEDGTIYQTLLYDPYLYAIKPNEPNAGSIIWSTYLSDRSRCSTWFEPNSYYMVGSPPGCGKCCYINASYNDVSISGWSEPALGPEGTIYISFDDPYLRAVDPNGSIKWISKLGTWSGFSLTVGSDGLIYAATEQGHLYVVKPNGDRLARFDSNNWPGFPVISADNMVVVGDTIDNTTLISYESNKVWAISGDGCDGQDPNLYWYGIEDLDGDAVLDYGDLALLTGDWLDCTYCWNPFCNRYQMFFAGDINRDYYVTFADFAILADKWLMGY